MNSYLFTRLLLLLFSLWALTGCIGEDMDGCTQYALKVKAIDVDGNDITQTGIVTLVDIFLFDQNGFVRMVPQGSSVDFLFGTGKDKHHTLVAWGNLKTDSLKLGDISVGTSIEDARLELGHYQDGYHLPSTDLFYSCRQVGPQDATRAQVEEKSITMIMERRAAGLSIATHAFAGRYPADAPYRFVVSGMATALNFLGEPVGDQAHCVPVGLTNKEGDIFAPPFRVFTTRENGIVSIDICRDKEVLHSVDRDQWGEPIRLVAGQHTHVDIYFSPMGRIEVKVDVVPWEEAEQFTQM